MNDINNEYYSEKAFSNIVDKYDSLIGEKYFFDNSIEKQELIQIIKIPHNREGDQYFVMFVSKQLKEILIIDFMRYNKLPFDYNDYKGV